MSFTKEEEMDIDGDDSILRIVKLPVMYHRLSPIKRTTLSSGIDELDRALDGGYSNPSNVMLLGPGGIRKDMLAYRFAQCSLKSEDEFTIFITADVAPASIKEKAAAHGIDLSGENIAFIDCYSSTIGLFSGEMGVIRIAGPQCLEDISFAINEIMSRTPGKKIRTVFHSLSTFLLFNPRSSVLKFLQVITGRLRNAGATSMFLVEDNAHDKQLISTVERLMDEKYAVLDRESALELEIPSLGLLIKKHF